MATETQAQTFVIDPTHSSVEFIVRHLVISKVRGGFRTFNGSLEVASNGLPVALRAEVDVNSIDTREEKRDGHLRSPDFFDAEKFPILTFASTNITHSGETNFVAQGDLTIHGVTKSVELTGEFEGRATDPWGNARVAYSAKTRINRKDFGMVWSQTLETGGLMVGDTVDIELSIQAIPQQ